MDTTNGGQKEMVRKCLGKKQTDCLQASDHANTRWECNFETQSKDEYNKHSKNIAKRVKWRDLVDNIKPDKDGWYRCVYYSTDRHHVQGHYEKGSDAMPSPQGAGGVDYYRSYPMNDWRAYPGAMTPTKKMGKRWGASSKDGEDDDDENISPDLAAREVKKIRQDANLMMFGHDSQGDSEKDDHYPHLLPETTKTEELMETIERRLELTHDMTEQVIDKLIKAGYTTVGQLRQLKREGFEKLLLPLAVEEEIKNQINATQRSMYNYMYPMMHPAYMYGFSQGGFQNQYAWPGFNQMGAGVYYNQVQPNYDTSDTVLSDSTGEVEKKMDKDENGMPVTMSTEHSAVDHSVAEHSAVGNVSQLESSNPESNSLVALSMASVNNPGTHGMPEHAIPTMPLASSSGVKEESKEEK